MGGVRAGVGARRACAIGDSGKNADGCGAGGARPGECSALEEGRQGRTGLKTGLGYSACGCRISGTWRGTGGGRGGAIAALRSIALVLCVVVCEDEEKERVVGVADGIRREQGAEGGAAESSQEFIRSWAQCARGSADKGSESGSGGSDASETARGFRAPV